MDRHRRNADLALAALAGVLLATLPAGCIVDERCREPRDCPGVKLCDLASGECVYECSQDSDCGGEGFYCEGHTCHFYCEESELGCPPDMVAVCGAFCIDVYEASRPDATSTSAGTDESQPQSVPGAIPWYSGALTPAEAATACAAAGKRLCTAQEWEAACTGVQERTYCYGDEYEPTVCNSIDAFCDEECGVYPQCHVDCPSDYKVMPTGSFPGCVSWFIAYDLSGNVWEAVQSDDGTDHFRGGAFNCGDPALAHKCGYDGLAAGSFPTARGFRCCSDGDPG